MRSAGALGLQNGVWVLPQRPEQKQILEDLLAYIREHGAGGFIFEVSALDWSIEDELIAQFQSDRDEEYNEFCERCNALLVELERETGHKKFTFAELEETEEDLHKLIKWLERINARDFFGSQRKDEGTTILARCQTAHQIFAEKVYQHQGVNPTNQSHE